MVEDAKPETASVGGEIEIVEFRAEPPEAPLPQGLPTNTTEPYALARAQEKARGLIAGALVVIVLIIVMFSFGTLWFTPAVKPADLKDLVSVLLGPVAALAGSAVGYYFGGKR